uniref:Uncharacterized protein n=1 Tax=Timema monikensis TaxID=170555 RepID=A0A7R9HNN3_9NEOP|nr:unnamed protein product [Timema monikensis]
MRRAQAGIQTLGTRKKPGESENLVTGVREGTVGGELKPSAHWTIFARYTPTSRCFPRVLIHGNIARVSGGKRSKNVAGVTVSHLQWRNIARCERVFEMWLLGVDAKHRWRLVSGYKLCPWAMFRVTSYLYLGIITQSEPSKRVRVTFFESSKPLAVTSPDPSDLLDLLDAPVGSVMTSSSPVPDSAPPYDRQARVYETLASLSYHHHHHPFPPSLQTKSNRGVDAPRPEARE